MADNAHKIRIRADILERQLKDVEDQLCHSPLNIRLKEEPLEEVKKKLISCGYNSFHSTFYEYDTNAKNSSSQDGPIQGIGILFILITWACILILASIESRQM
jgi:hypothetical protein